MQVVSLQFDHIIYIHRILNVKKNLINSILDLEKEYEKKDIPSIHVGDTVRLGIRIVEGKTERVQYYEGVVIGIKNFSIKKTK